MGGGKSADRPWNTTREGGDSGSGVVGPQVVLADRFDGRSRRTTRGPARPGVKSARKRQGLAAQPSPTGGASSRKSVGSRPRVAKLSGRWRVRVRGQARKRRAERASVDGRRPGALGASVLDGTGGKTQPAVDSRFGARPSSQRRQRKSSSPKPRADNAAGSGVRTEGPFRSRTRRIGPRPSPHADARGA